MVRTRYDDGGYSGGSTERPALQTLLADIRDRRIDVVVVYKVDRLTRSLADFAKLVELFDAHGISFVSVTQQFKTTTSMGRLTLNVLLSFAQFEREVTGERIRDRRGRRRGLRRVRPPSWFVLPQCCFEFVFERSRRNYKRAKPGHAFGGRGVDLHKFDLTAGEWRLRQHLSRRSDGSRRAGLAGCF
jgi:DNA invertase Pin-like site-specific DNA recombinase